MALRRYERGDYETLHEAAIDSFARSQHGREIWELHIHGNVPLVTSQAEMTRAQKLVLQAAHSHHSEDPDDSIPNDVPSV